MAHISISLNDVQIGIYTRTAISTLATELKDNSRWQNLEYDHALNARYYKVTIQLVS